MKKTVVHTDWLHLETSKQFDAGLLRSSSNKRLATKETPLPTRNSLFIESLILQLCRLLEKDPKKQRQIYKAICTKLCDLRVIDESFQSEEFASLRSHYWDALSLFLQTPDVHAPLLETSRYALEYQELGKIASGGFGQVFRARHLLDQMEYAVKKIKVRNKSTAVFLQTFSEVKTLARLNHPNIVQYKAAWLEVCSLPSAPAIRDASLSDGSDWVEFENSSEFGSENSDDQECQALQPYRPSKWSSSPQVGAVLFVSMELCDETLRQWLDRRNADNEPVDVLLAANIMRQAAAGIAYIHRQNVVHHDVKPNNIFVSGDMRVQVGDFGLACNIQGVMSSCPLLNGQRGTSLYAAPEQLKGKCHQKSDLFSLGLVFLELLLTFATDMERVDVLKNARNKALPSEVPTQAKGLLLDLLNPKPNDRPSASELYDRLQYCMESSMDEKDRTILRLRKRLAECDKLLAQRDLEIQKLKEDRDRRSSTDESISS